METKNLQEIQKNYDKDYWELDNDDFEKIRHITHHIGKLMGKISGYCEEKEHKNLKDGNVSTEIIQKQVIPDLMTYALQLSNVLNVDLEKEYLDRIERNKKYFNKST